MTTPSPLPPVDTHTLKSSIRSIARRDVLLFCAMPVLSYGLAFALVYGVGCFSAGTSDITQWTTGSREAAAAVALGLGTLLLFVVFLVTLVIHEEVEEAARNRIALLAEKRAAASKPPLEPRRQLRLVGRRK